MGPYSEGKQASRAASIRRLLATQPKLSEDMKNVWLSKLQGLAQNEDEYNARVKDVFKDLKKSELIDYGQI